MKNSDETLCRFGTPLEPLEEDDVPSKKRVPIEEQVVKDENGRRRFHGAFTGGFSAGFWNTVGSLEGWKPQSFKSSRSEKAEKRVIQAPTDFMDDEDLGEFGIAPQRVQARDDFASNNQVSTQKRKLDIPNSCPIPGIPVLHQLLEPSKEKVAVRLLRRMGWKPGQGIGARQTRKEKTCTKVRNSNDIYIMKMYGCAVKAMQDCSRDLSDLSDDEELTFAPDDFDPFICSNKDNRFGLGYSGLHRSREASSHINLFGPLELIGKNNKKLSIRGQAFGVGALEEEDDDIYANDDMSKYDFNLGNKSKSNKKKIKEIPQDLTILDGFAEASSDINIHKISHLIELNSNFLPRNWSHRKSRFEPLADDKISLIIQTNFDRKKGLGRHDLKPAERGKILDTKNSEIKNEKKGHLQHINDKYKEIEEPNEKLLHYSSSQGDNVVTGGVITKTKVEAREIQICENIATANDKLLPKTTAITEPLEKPPGLFRPFANNESKQERYEQFIKANLKQDDDIKGFLNNIQPVHLSDWHKEMEQKEFIQARNIYKPLNGLMSERFVSKSIINSSKNSQKNKNNEKVKCKVERSKIIWKPSTIICKCFNIPEPFGGAVIEQKLVKKTKFSIFDYIENSINSRQDFITPVIIPKSVEKPKEIITQVKDLNTESFISKDTPHKIIPKVDKVQTHQTTFTNVLKKPKTELEIRVLESINKHTSEKKDLFMSIFDCSSNDDDYDKADLQKSSQTSYTDEIEKTLTKSSATINALRNTSPPRGIFAALFSGTVPKEKVQQHPNEDKLEQSGNMTSKPLLTTNEQEYVSEQDCAYGPKVPTHFNIENRKFSQEDNIDKKLAELLSKKSTKTTKIVETWIEKTGQSIKKDKKVKKSKKKKDVKDRKKTKHKYKKNKK